MEKAPELVIYCPHCGQLGSSYFYVGQFVLAQVPGTGPFYGKVCSIERTDNGPMVIVEKSPNERVSAHIDYVQAVEGG